MKSKIIIFVLAFFVSITSLLAQAPPNDDCTGAIPIVLGSPPPCGSGLMLGPVSNVNGNITLATPGSPYIYQPGCSGAGGPSQAFPANDVWYSFVATGFQCVVSITSTFANPNIAFYSGTCAALGGGIGGCAVGAGGTVTLTVNQLVPGTTYYLQVSGNTGQTGTFNMSIQNNKDCSDCLTGSNITVNPLPVNGAYAANTTVNFCLHISSYKTINTNWLHGVQLTFGSGWNAASIVPNTPTPINAAGTWSYYPAGIGTVNAQTWGPGWYYDFLPNDGIPANNFGDSNSGGVPGFVDVSTAAQWNFCFSITTNAVCTPGSNLGVTYNTSGDGESGSWSNAGCANDAAVVFNAIGACCPPNMSALPAKCYATNTGSATATPVGAAGPYTYNWAGPAGFTSTLTNVAGANTVSNVASGIYTVTIIDHNLCAVSSTVQVTQPTSLTPTTSFTNASCAGNGTASVTVSGGTGPYTYIWAPSGGNASSASVPVGTYTVLINDNNLCASSATVNVGITAVLPVPTISSNGPICFGQDLVLTGGGGVSYQWDGPSLFSSTVQNPTITAANISSSGIYTLTVVGANSCTNSITLNVIVNPQPIVSATGATVCSGNNANLTANGGVSYSWTGPNGYVSLNQNAVIIAANPLSEGQYTVFVTDANTCTNVAVVNVTTSPVPSPTLTSNGPLCLGSVLSLSVVGGDTYQWSGPNNFNSTLQTFTLSAASNSVGGVYTATATSVIGCKSSSTIDVVINPLPTVSVTSNKKNGCVPLCINFTTTSSSQIQNYSWNLNNGIPFFGTGPNAAGCYTAAGVFTISSVVIDNNGCQNTGTFSIEAYPKPIADFDWVPKKPIVNVNSDVSFYDESYGANVVSWNWFFMSNEQYQSTQKNPVFVYKEPLQYLVALVVKSDKGCTDTVLKPLVIGEDYGIWIPNAFTPNDDNFNNVFEPKGYGIVKYTMSIFDRWGEKIYTSNDFSVGWNGYKNGTVCQDDVYIYKIIVTNVFNVQKEYVGHVTLYK
jgi:gliding motility-associated-like protein